MIVPTATKVGPVATTAHRRCARTRQAQNANKDWIRISGLDTLKGGIEDIIGTFPKADGSGTFQFGIRIAPSSNGSYDLVTLLTRQ